MELKVDFHEGINLEALYLIGKFGVQVDKKKKTLTKLQEKLFAGEMTKQGLPFYSGKIKYLITTCKKLNKDERALISVEDFEAACIKVISKPGMEKIIAWQPYEVDITYELDAGGLIIEAVLTRRNTFRPLHQLPLLAASYGPSSFVTEGDTFTEDYMLISSGLLKGSTVRIMQQ